MAFGWTLSTQLFSFASVIVGLEFQRKVIEVVAQDPLCLQLLLLLFFKSPVVLCLYPCIGPTTLSNRGCAVSGFSASDDTQKSHRSRHRMHKSSGSSHRTMSRSLSCDSQSKGSVSTPRGSSVFFFLPFPSLSKISYKKKGV